MQIDRDFFRNRKVFITGHTGFKGAWLCKILTMQGAEVTGYSLEPPTKPSLFELASLKDHVHSIIGDVRDLNTLKKTFDAARPEFVFHLAAQPIVREGYKNPVYTYETNVIGTVNVLECVRQSTTVRSFLNVTTDKVYENKEWEWGYRENESLDGFDPYSNSKSCSELVTHSYKRSFFSKGNVLISTARAGNVIGGGDFADDRIIADCVRAVASHEDIIVRNPHSIRPYQHVLEPLFAYMLITAKQLDNPGFEGNYNVGPDEQDCITTGSLVNLFTEKWGGNLEWINKFDGGPHEANYLKLDCSKLKTKLGWQPRWNVEQAIEKTVEWTKAWLNKEDINTCMEKQINEFLDS